MTNCRQFSNNPGYLLAQLSEQDLEPVWAEVRAIEQNFESAESVVRYLTGNIRHEYQLRACRAHVENLLQPLVAEYVDVFQYAGRLQQLNTNCPLVIAPDDLWVNFQGPGEFNPPHHHSGVFSFVIWLQIPYTWAEELAAGPGRDGYEPENGQFVMHYTDTLGQIRQERLWIDSSRQNSICLFPNTMIHHVSPFYSTDRWRISVAGNLKFKVI
jgi:hypothetical protein